MTRIGVIGTGAISRVHLDAWRAMPVELAGYYDIDRRAAEQAVDAYGGVVFDSVDALLDHVDMVDVCTPGTAHVVPVLAAAAAGKAVILDVGIHDIDYQRWCLGEVEQVFTRGLTFAGNPRNDHALIVLRFESGAIGHIQCSWAHPSGVFRTRLEIAGTDGLIEWDSLDTPSLAIQRRSANDTTVEDRYSFLALSFGVAVTVLPQ